MIILPQRCRIGGRAATSLLSTHLTTRSTRRARFAAMAAAAIAVSFPLPACAQSASTAPVQIADPWQPFVDEAAARFSVPASWIRAIIRVESNGNPAAVSPKGAVGLMQLMPLTYAELRARCGLGDDPKDPHDNIIAGTAYLRDMRERFGSAGFVAAYNAGPQRYEDHLATGRPLPDETLAYVARLAPLLSDASLAGNRTVASDRGSWQRASLLVNAPSNHSDRSNWSFTPQATFARNGRTAADLSALAPFPGDLFVGKRNTPAKP